VSDLSFDPDDSDALVEQAMEEKDLGLLERVLSSASFSPDKLTISRFIFATGTRDRFSWLGQNPLLVVWLLEPPGARAHLLCCRMIRQMIAEAYSAESDRRFPIDINRAMVSGLAGVRLDELPHGCFEEWDPFAERFSVLDGYVADRSLGAAVCRGALARIADHTYPPLNRSPAMETAAQVVAGCKSVRARNLAGLWNPFKLVFP
jgi:hypothetical protein